MKKAAARFELVLAESGPEAAAASLGYDPSSPSSSSSLAGNRPISAFDPRFDPAESEAAAEYVSPPASSLLPYSLDGYSHPTSSQGEPLWADAVTPQRPQQHAVHP